MSELDLLQDRLRELDEREEAIHQERASVTRQFVAVAGGLTEAASRLQADPRTVVQQQRRNEVAFVIYRGPAPSPVINGHVYGEIGQVGPDQRWADAHWWRIARAMRPMIRLLIIVVNGEVTRIWEVLSAEHWEEDPEGSGKVGIPLANSPLTPQEVLRDYPDLGIALNDRRPARQGLMREYVPIRGS
jgi:hypothetical protein